MRRNVKEGPNHMRSKENNHTIT